jgi:hypothetical protein
MQKNPDLADTCSQAMEPRAWQMYNALQSDLLRYATLLALSQDTYYLPGMQTCFTQWM